MTPIIIINWNGINDTKECVASITACTRSKYKIYLIDNGSKNNEGERLHHLYIDHENIEVICYKQNWGFSEGHNKIWSEKLQKTKAPFIALMNNDTIVTKGWLTELLKSAAKANSQLVAPLFLDYYNRNVIDNVGHELFFSGEILPHLNGQDTGTTPNKSKLVGVCGGACLISARLIRKIEFFDSYFSTGYEDAEFGLRAVIAKARIGYSEQSIVYHKGGNSVRKVFSSDYAVTTQRNAWYTVAKLYPTLALIIITPYLLCRNLLIILASFVFLKWHYCKILILAIYQFSKYDLKLALQARKRMSNLSKIRLIDFLRLQKSSIIFDLNRVSKYFIGRQQSSLDKYR